VARKPVRAAADHASQTSFDLVANDSKRTTRTSSWIFSKIAPLRPTKVFDTYWRFAAERQAVFFRRYEGQREPWTDDPILQRHKFTNVYRASDRVSQYLIDKVIYLGDQSPVEVFFRTLLFKLFNRIETWTLLLRELGDLRSDRFDLDSYSRVLLKAIERGDRIYSAAYIMPPAAHQSGERKHETHLALLAQMLATSAPERIFSAPNLKTAFTILKTYPGIGDFLAYQFAVDLNYSECAAFSENEFVVPGPGARDGIRKCFADLGGLSESDVIRVMVDRQEAEFARLGLAFRDLWGRPLHLIDCQNLFCEVGKYSRVAHPDVSGISARTRIKQHFRPLSRLLRFAYPPKWGLPSAVTVVRNNKW
jgi:hypothetical protein